MGREEILKILRDDVAKATNEERAANDRFIAAVRSIPSGLPHPDGVQNIRNVAAADTDARNKLVTARSRLHKFVVYGVVPEDLDKPK